MDARSRQRSSAGERSRSRARCYGKLSREDAKKELIEIREAMFGQPDDERRRR